MSGKTATRLTVEALKGLQVGQELRCHVVAGLQARRKAGGISWHVYYRDGRGDRRRPTIGKYPALGIEPAREAAKKLLQAVARGEDPSAAKQADRAALRVRDLVTRYLQEEGPNLKPRSLAIYRQTLGVIVGRIGTLRAADVTPDDLRRALEAFGGPYAANNGRRVFRRVWNVARKHWRLPLPENPVEATKANPHRARKRVASGVEMRAITTALEAQRLEYPEHVACILCLVYTGARVSELTTAKRPQMQVGPDGGRLTLTEHKTDRTGDVREIELPRQALEEIAALPIRPDGYIFGPQYDAVHALWVKVRASAGCDGLRMHDLRRTWASHGKSAGMSLHATGELLGHKATQTTAGYAYLFEDARASGAQAIADSVDRARSKPAVD